MLAHRLRRWPIIEQTSGEGLVLAGSVVVYHDREMAISTNEKPTIYRNLYENTGPECKFNYISNEIINNHSRHITTDS